jgi:hypothetical protein
MTAASATEAPRKLLAYRDDGPVAGAIGAVLGRAARIPPPALAVAGALPLFVAIVITGDGASDELIAGVLAWFIVVAGASAGRLDTGRLRWISTPVLRATEYAALTWMGAIAGGSGVAAAFALMCVLAFRHYDLVYRQRHLGIDTPAWVGVLSGGWAGRLIAAWVLLVAGALPTGFFIAAAVFGVVFVAESAVSWLRSEPADELEVYDEEEDEEAAE